MNTFVCPYCFEQNKKKDIEYRCLSERCKDVDDLEMTKYERGDITNPKKGKVTFKGKSRNLFRVSKSAICPEPGCGEKTFKVICPSCHNILPESSYDSDGENTIISIVGGRDTGKSHYVAVLINELKKTMAESMGTSLEGFDDTEKRYREFFWNPLFKERQKISLTSSSLQSTENGAYRPLIFTLRFPSGHGFKRTTKSYTLVFFDSAGEDLNEQDTMSNVNKYICKSSGIIFLLDPLKIPEVVNQLRQDIVLRASTVNADRAGDADMIMTRVSNLIRNDRGMNRDEKIDIPVAAVFSKFDAIAGLVPEGSVVHEPSPHMRTQGAVVNDIQNVDMEIKGLLSTWQDHSLITQLDTNYKRYSFFAASSLGIDNNPELDGSIKKPTPHRVVDPLFWLLSSKGIFQKR